MSENTANVRFAKKHSVMVAHWDIGQFVLRHALQETGLQRQKNVGPLVGSRAKKLSHLCHETNEKQTVTAPHVVFVFLHIFEYSFLWFVILEQLSPDMFSMPSKVQKIFVSWANYLVGVQS